MKAFKKELKAMKTRSASEPEIKEERFSFADAMKGVKPLVQDKVPPNKRVELNKKKHKAISSGLTRSKQVSATFTFSDMYQAALPSEGPVRYCRDGVPTHVLKQLRRGDYSPELMLDLHGLTRELAKQEISALLYTAKKESIHCVSIMHGFGQGVLKNALPHYLVQHPSVNAFHQAPLEYGGQAALLVLVDVPSPFDKQ